MRTVTLKDGNVLAVHDNEDLSNHIVREGDYFEREILDYLKENHKEQSVILDIGANIGNHTVFFASYLNYELILAIEPIPDNIELLTINTNKFTGIQVRQVAVGDSNVDVMMKINRGNMGACEVSPDGDISVHQIRLDDLLILPVSLIKLDVEWYEIQVLEGGKEIITEDKPLILIEDSSSSYGTYMKETFGYYIKKGWPEHKTYLYGWGR